MPISSPRMLGDVSAKFDSLYQSNKTKWELNLIKCHWWMKWIWKLCLFHHRKIPIYHRVFFTLPHLSKDGSLLNISVGTVVGASNMPISDCLDCKCRSTSSAVMWPSVIVSVLIVSVFMMAGVGGMVLFAFFCVCFRRFGGLAFLFWVEFVALFFRLEINVWIVWNFWRQAVKFDLLSNIFDAATIIFRRFRVVVTLRFRIVWFFILQQTIE